VKPSSPVEQRQCQARLTPGSGEPDPLLSNTDMAGKKASRGAPGSRW